MKMIRFDLPIDGVKVSALDQLRDHFTTEIINHFRSGLLAKWLRSRGFAEQLSAIEMIEGTDDGETLNALCKAFDIEATEDVIQAALSTSQESNGIHIERFKELRNNNEFVSICMNTISREREKMTRLFNSNSQSRSINDEHNILLTLIEHVRVIAAVRKLLDEHSGQPNAEYIAVTGWDDTKNCSQFPMDGDVVKRDQQLLESRISDARSPCNGVIRDAITLHFRLGTERTTTWCILIKSDETGVNGRQCGSFTVERPVPEVVVF
jgi:hypothetical protein